MRIRRVIGLIAVAAQLVVGALVATVPVVTGLVAGPGPAAASCRRQVIINPQVSVGEGAGSLTVTVYSGGCPAAGALSYVVIPGTATQGTVPPADFTLAGGQLLWSAGDRNPRAIAAQIFDDSVIE